MMLALDATSTRVIGLSAEDVTHVRLAYEQGLGQMLEEKIVLTGARANVHPRHYGEELTEAQRNVLIAKVYDHVLERDAREDQQRRAA